MGKFQQPVQAAGKSIDLFGLKAYLFNVAALSLGFKGVDRRAPPPPPPAAVEPAAPEDATRLTLKQASVVSLGEQCVNQLDRAAYLYGDPCNYYIMRLLVNVLGSTAELHGRPAGGDKADLFVIGPWEVLVALLYVRPVLSPPLMGFLPRIPGQLRLPTCPSRSRALVVLAPVCSGVWNAIALGLAQPHCPPPRSPRTLPCIAVVSRLVRFRAPRDGTRKCAMTGTRVSVLRHVTHLHDISSPVLCYRASGATHVVSSEGSDQCEFRGTAILQSLGKVRFVM